MKNTFMKTNYCAPSATLGELEDAAVLCDSFVDPGSAGNYNSDSDISYDFTF